MYSVLVIRSVSQPGEIGPGDYGPWFDPVAILMWLADAWFGIVTVRLAMIGRWGGLALAVGLLVAAASLGGTEARALFKHILPNVVPLILADATLQLGTLILAEAGLSFLGLGIQPPTPEWGAMVSTAREYLVLAPHTFIFPTLAILVTVISFNLLGDGLRDALDPTT